MRYDDQLRIFERETAAVGLGNSHGLRYAYAQERYRELTGWDCSIVGDPTKQEFSATQRSSDLEV
ncbi:MAG: integrase [Gammaproteobacteria bacterium]|nr:integrase [Gammaproteobacteria bacterium]